MEKNEYLEELKKIVESKSNMQTINNELSKLKEEIKKLQVEETKMLPESKLRPLKKAEIDKKQAELEEKIMQKNEMDEELKNKIENVKENQKQSIEKEMSMYKTRDEIAAQKDEIDRYRMGIVNLSKEVERLEQEIQEIAEEIKNGKTDRMERMNAASAMIKSDKNRIANYQKMVNEFDNYKVLEDNIQEYSNLENMLIRFSTNWSVEKELQMFENEKNTKQEVKPQPQTQSQPQTKSESLKSKENYDWGSLTEEQIDELWAQGITPDSQEYKQAFGNFVKTPDVTEVSDVEAEAEPYINTETDSVPPIPKETRLQKLAAGIGNFFNKVKNFGPIKFIGKHLTRFGRFIARKVREMQQDVTAHYNDDYEQEGVEEKESKTDFEQVKDLLGKNKEVLESEEKIAPAVDKEPKEEVVNGDYSDRKRAKRNDSAKDDINNGKMPTRPLLDEVGPYVEDNGKRVYLNNEDGTEKPLEEVKKELSETIKEIMGKNSNSWEVSDEVKAEVVEVGKNADTSSEKIAPAKGEKEIEI